MVNLMWKKVAHLLLRYRIGLLIGCGLYFVVMLYGSSQIRFNFKPYYILPSSDPVQRQFEGFISAFEASSTQLTIGIRDSSLYRMGNFLRFKRLTDTLSTINGVDYVLSVANAPRLVKDVSRKRFELRPFFSPFPRTQRELDSLLFIFKKQRFYADQLMKDSLGSTLLLLNLDKKILESRRQNRLIESISEHGRAFSASTGIPTYYGGLPYLRHITTKMVRKEIFAFIIASVLIVLAIFYSVFRSRKALYVCSLLVLISSSSVLGLMGLMDYKISIVTALIPPIIVIVAVTNCVYFTNKYHQSYARSSSKVSAIIETITQIGHISLITNLTTAIGFLVLYSVRVSVLQELGVVAGLSILLTFLLSMALLPSVFYFLPPPTIRHTRHLRSKMMKRLLRSLSWMTYKHKRVVVGLSILLILVSIYGASLLEANTYMRENVSSSKKDIENLKFLEQHFGGLMPLEVIIETSRKKGFLGREVREKLAELDAYMDTMRYVSSPLSLNRLLKATRQAYYNEDPRFYDVPHGREFAMISRYFMGLRSKSNPLYRIFVDSTEQKTRVSVLVDDIGSKRLDLLAIQLEHYVDSLFSPLKGSRTYLSGASLPFVRGNQFLVKNLFLTLIQAFILIALGIALLFRRWNMIWSMLVVNIIPLLMVAGVMGFAGIALTSSTALIFSISYGIAIDNSIHFFSKYRMALQREENVFLAVRSTITQIGSSMIYTALILLAGFAIFTFSSFNGIHKLGWLTSLTLFLALLSNIILFPTLLLYIDRGAHRSSTRRPKV